MVSGCVGFIGVFARTLGPSRSKKARFVRKVSTFFQVVNWPGGDAVSHVAARLPTQPDRRRDRTRSPLPASCRRDGERAGRELSGSSRPLESSGASKSSSVRPAIAIAADAAARGPPGRRCRCRLRGSTRRKETDRRIARRVSPRTNRNCIGLSAMRSIVSSSAARNSAPSPGRRPSYQSRVSSASASASGLKLTRRLTLDPAASGGLHPTGWPTQAAERDPPSVCPAPQPPQASTPARLLVRPQRGFPRAPSRARRARPRGVSEVRKRRRHRLILCQYSATGCGRWFLKNVHGNDRRPETGVSRPAGNRGRGHGHVANSGREAATQHRRIDVDPEWVGRCHGSERVAD